MAEEITVGTVLGGRYLVTGEVVATAEGDLVFDGTDQVLNRPVSILMAAPSNATRVAVSAREIAMGTRPSDVQVLDLGLNAASTYLITNTTDAASLLDLVVEADAPYIEPFQTDTLGQQIFGETRSTEPQVYSDDAEYYQELAEEQQRKPLFGGRWGRKNRAEATPETDSQGVIPPEVPLTGAGVSEPVTGPFAAEPMAASQAAAAFPTEPHQDSSPASSASPAASATPEDERTQSVPRAEAAQPAVTPLPPVTVEPTSTLRSDEDAARAAAQRGDANRPASRFPRAAAAPAAGTAAAPDDAASRERQTSAGAVAGAGVGAGVGAGAAAASDTAAKRSAFDAAVGQAPRASVPAAQRSGEDGGNKLTRLIVGLLLVAVLVTGVIFAVQILTRTGEPVPTPVATAPAAPNESEPPASPQATEGPSKVKPKVDDISLAFPSNPESVYSTSNQSLEDAVDGSSSSSFSTYTYKSPVFGGFTKRATFAIELKKESDISAVELAGMNAKGGKVQISVGESDDPDAAQDIFSGSFSGPSLSAEVGAGETMKGKFVFVTITELPQLASPVSAERPYGFQVSEIKVS
ncbi:hypothetical protein [Galactobacter caseinivorans]|uniref:Uncharacterized protein n=1 Tax=Galactobacter caseinivorans TaxID=2676123 RepID=A0A496PIM6_9MICC|nr:hypothetical protein [Galactobacter caseinivorans]RKW70352.1 hypothetical protein DWQ67_07615 [Galactobacter caseinivorans]